MKSPHQGLALFVAIFVAHASPGQSSEDPGARPAPPLDEPLVARPGMMIGRVMTWDGRPVPRFTIGYAAYAVGSNGVRIDGDAEPNVVAKVDGRDGYYEIRLPEGSYGLVSGITLPLLEGNQTFRFWAETPGTTKLERRCRRAGSFRGRHEPDLSLAAVGNDRFRGCGHGRERGRA